MLVIPAIDMLGGKAVRLKQGRALDATVYSNSVIEMAERWVAEDATRLHLVDLDGAFNGAPAHCDQIVAIAKKFPAIKTQVGGGIRDAATLARYFDAGVSFCILGTAAIQDPEFVNAACQNHPGKIILGVDARDGMVATHGWNESSKTPVIALLTQFKDCVFESVVTTDIARDGALSGMNLASVALVRDAGRNVIASGGLTSLEDIDALKKLGGVYGVIAGKAIYEKRFTLTQALTRASC